MSSAVMKALRQCFAVVFNHDVIEDNGDESPYLNKLAVEFSKEDLSFLQGAMKLDSRDRLSAGELSLSYLLYLLEQYTF